MKNGKSLGFYFATLVIVLLFSGCTVPAEKPLEIQEPIPPEPKKASSPVYKKPRIEKSTVYFYRPDKSISGWTWKGIGIMEIHAVGIITDPDDLSQVSQIGDLNNNSYIKKEFKPGAHRFTANWQLEPYVFTLKPNEDMCIKAEIGFVNALRQRATLKKADKSSCESYIKQLEEMEKEKKAKEVLNEMKAEKLSSEK